MLVNPPENVLLDVHNLTVTGGNSPILHAMGEDTYKHLNHKSCEQGSRACCCVTMSAASCSFRSVKSIRVRRVSFLVRFRCFSTCLVKEGEEHDDHCCTLKPSWLKSSSRLSESTWAPFLQDTKTASWKGFLLKVMSLVNYL